MKRVTYIRKGPVVVLKSPGVVLTIGRTPYRYDRWVVSRDVFQMLRKRNPEVEFVAGSK